MNKVCLLFVGNDTSQDCSCANKCFLYYTTGPDPFEPVEKSKVCGGGAIALQPGRRFRRQLIFKSDCPGK